MKKSAIWDTLEHAPILDLIAMPHVHNKRPGLKCATEQMLALKEAAHGMRLHVFHDDQNLYVVKLPNA